MKNPSSNISLPLWGRKGEINYHYYTHGKIWAKHPLSMSFSTHMRKEKNKHSQVWWWWLHIQLLSFENSLCFLVQAALYPFGNILTISPKGKNKKLASKKWFHHSICIKVYGLVSVESCCSSRWKVGMINIKAILRRQLFWESYSKGAKYYFIMEKKLMDTVLRFKQFN